MRTLRKRCQIAIRPKVWWYVQGRKQFGKEPLAIRKSWKVGAYQTGKLITAPDLYSEDLW